MAKARRTEIITRARSDRAPFEKKRDHQPSDSFNPLMSCSIGFNIEPFAVTKCAQEETQRLLQLPLARLAACVTALNSMSWIELRPAVADSKCAATTTKSEHGIVAQFGRCLEFLIGSFLLSHPRKKGGNNSFNTNHAGPNHNENLSLIKHRCVTS